jgi:hypothetical protein
MALVGFFFVIQAVGKLLLFHDVIRLMNKIEHSVKYWPDIDLFNADSLHIRLLVFHYNLFLAVF